MQLKNISPRLFYLLVGPSIFFAQCSKSDPAPPAPPPTTNPPPVVNPPVTNPPVTNPPVSNSPNAYKGIYNVGFYYANNPKPYHVIAETAGTSIKMDTTAISPHIQIEFHNLGMLGTYSIGTTRYAKPSVAKAITSAAQMNTIQASDTTYAYMKRFKSDGSDIATGVRAEYLILCSTPSGDGWIGGSLFPGSEAQFKSALENAANTSNPQLLKYKVH